ncbi:MAG: ankyrin repeat domain-containing protein [Trueperaceae bacterium]|nr:ankyrin repeat domain-containing protein [Trueperaceae bacterium]
MVRGLLVVLVLAVAAFAALWSFGVVGLPGGSPPVAGATEQAALLDAAESGDPAAIRLALGEGAPVDGTDPFGRTALMLAAAGGHDDALSALLAAGADVHAQADSGWTALMFAADAAPTASTPLLLLNAGSDPHVADAEGRRALELAADNAAVRSSGLWSRLEELTEWPASLRELRDGEAFARGWPSAYLLPIEGATISSRASHLPGSPRAYRNGTHEGFDFYDGTVSVDIAYGAEQRAVASGEVIRADVDYQELDQAAYDDLIDAAVGSLDTPPEVLDALRGRQVWIRHAGGFVTRYAHLSGVAEGIVAGAPVAQGAVIGFTGNSGTVEAAQGTEDDPHPHVEIWRGDETYLGQGLEPGEIYAIAAQVFGVDALPPFTDGGLRF